jgi:hypothetical protein
MRFAWAVLFSSVLVTLVPPGTHAAAWSDVFAADSGKVVFFGTDGTLLRAPFSLATRETLWTPTGGQHLVRVRVSPDGQRVAWLTRGDDRDTTRLWVDGPQAAVLRVRYFGLESGRYGRVHSEPGVPTIEDPGALGARLVQPGALMRRLVSNTLEWTPDSRAVVFGYNDGIAAVSADGGVGFSVSKALAVHLDPLGPAPIYLVDAIVLRQHLQYFNQGLPGQLATEETGPIDWGDMFQDRPVMDAMELAHPDMMISKAATSGTYLLYPMAHRWRVFTASDLIRSRLRAASPGTVWWATGSTIRAIRTADPKPTDEVRAAGPVVWLGYDEPHRALVWAGGREVGRRSEDGGPVSVVLRTGSSLRAGLVCRRSPLVGLVTSDSLLVWDPADDTVRGVSVHGLKPSALFVGRGGEILVATERGKGSPPGLARADFSAGRLTLLDTPEVNGGMFHAPGNGAWILLYDPGVRPPSVLQVYDVQSGRWTAVQNPGFSGWEPLEAR